jgi:hypothetical protein
MNFTFRDGEQEDIDKLSWLILAQPLNYIGYKAWAEKALEEFLWGIKQAGLCFCDDHLVGELIYQQHKIIPSFLELKNGRVLEEFGRRLILSFLIRQVEIDARKKGYLAVVCDSRSGRKDVNKFLKINGYRELARADIYGEGIEDIIYLKSLVEDERLIVPAQRELIRLS